MRSPSLRSMASQQINKPGAMTVWDMQLTGWIESRTAKDRQWTMYGIKSAAECRVRWKPGVLRQFLSQSRRLPPLQVVSNSKFVSVGVHSPTEINAPRGCAVILIGICQLRWPESRATSHGRSTWISQFAGTPIPSCTRVSRLDISSVKKYFHFYDF